MPASSTNKHLGLRKNLGCKDRVTTLSDCHEFFCLGEDFLLLLVLSPFTLCLGDDPFMRRGGGGVKIKKKKHIITNIIKKQKKKFIKNIINT